MVEVLNVFRLKFKKSGSGQGFRERADFVVGGKQRPLRKCILSSELIKPFGKGFGFGLGFERVEVEATKENGDD